MVTWYGIYEEREDLNFIGTKLVVYSYTDFETKMEPY
jgi:hypothetical protein